MRKAAEIASAFAPRERLDGFRSFFLVGIGGAGMSALARMLHHRGFSVSGTDSTQSSVTDDLSRDGIGVHIGHTGDGILAGTAVVLTDAIDLPSSPEVERARDVGAPLFRRSQALGWLLRGHKVIAVTGTHGKTTTTGMIGAGLMAAGLDPLIVVGANVPQFGGPVVEGKGEWAVVEACEAYDSFHDIDPFMVVLTNLEPDHLDYHGTYENLRDSVIRFVLRIDPERKHGPLIYHADERSAEVARAVMGQVNVTPFCSVPMVVGGSGGPLTHEPLPELALPGEHNRANAEAAFLACEQAGADVGKAIQGIAGFKGAERRLQLLLETPIVVIDDYAHHPTEVTASLSAVRDRFLSHRPATHRRDADDTHGRDGHATNHATGRLIVVFQPHLYSRTAAFISEFAEALSLADQVVLTDIYPAREDPIPGISSARIAELVTKPVTYVPNRHLLARKVAAMVRPGDVVVAMGAGNIAEFAPALVLEVERGTGVPPVQGHGPKGSATHGQAGRATRVAVVYGGNSTEREVSLHSGRAVHAALLAKGYASRLVDVSDLLSSKGDLSSFVGPGRPDIAFLAVHGTDAEDGAIQGLFELLHIPYTGSRIQASALAMDKEMTKRILEAAGIRTPMGQLLTSENQSVAIKLPLIVKPNSQGSTVGLSFVENEENVKAAVDKAFAYDDAVLVEEWVRGMEISVPVLGDRALPPVEIVPASGRYDFASKYAEGATEEIVPARLPESVLEQAQEIALRTHRALGCRGATRTDMIVRVGITVNPITQSEVNLRASAGMTASGSSTPQPPSSSPPSRDEEGGSPEIVVLEINTLPGLTQTSLLPNSAKAAGISFEDLAEWIVQDALERHANKA